MSFHKLRSLKEAEEVVWLDRSDPRLPDRIRRVWNLGFRLSPRYFPPGIYRFRSIEEMNRFDARQRRKNVEAQQRRLRDRAQHAPSPARFAEPLAKTPDVEPEEGDA